MPLPFFAFALLGLLGLHLAVAVSPRAVHWPLDDHGILLLHLAVLGWITPVMMGADYQLVPVVLHRPLRHPTLAHIVLALYGAGVVVFLVGWGTGKPLFIAAGGTAAGCALLLFCAHAGSALIQADRASPTALGLGGGMVALAFTAILGPWLALSMADSVPGSSFAVLRGIHATVALGGWLLLTIMGATYQLIPFFAATAPAIRPRFGTAAVLGSAVGIILLVLAALGLAIPAAAGLVVLGASVALWMADLARMARGGRQARREPIISYSLAGAGSVVAGGGVAAITWGSDAHLALAGALLASVAGPSLLILGQLQKIVPFIAALDASVAAKRRGKVPKTEALFPRHRAWILLPPLALGFAAEIAGVATAAPLVLRVGAILVLLAALGYVLQQSRAVGPWMSARRAR